MLLTLSSIVHSRCLLFEACFLKKVGIVYVMRKRIFPFDSTDWTGLDALITSDAIYTVWYSKYRNVKLTCLLAFVAEDAFFVYF